MFSSRNLFQKTNCLVIAKLVKTLTICALLTACNTETSQGSTTDKVQTDINSIQIQTGLPDRFNIGSPATSQLIVGWDIDIRPDGKGLPNGFGSVLDGEVIYEEKCALCHGTFGEGQEQWPKLTGGEGSLTDPRPLKTIASYWPYATTLWDYINKAMPFPAPQSLQTNEVYAVTAYVLNLNELVDEDFILNQDNLPLIEMPNKNGFYADNRPDTSNTRCMKNCKKYSELQINLGPKYVRVASSSSKETIANKDDGFEGKRVYEQACFICHTSGATGAPKLANNSDWSARIDKKLDRLYTNALQGFNSMPAKGGRTDLSDEQVKLAVDYMLESLK